MESKLFSKNSHSSRGQAAIEFLTTYGWMFMIVLVVFGGLVYFGFTDLKSNLPTVCRFNSAFDCTAFHAVEDGSYAVEIINVDSKPVNITNFVCGFPQIETVIRYDYESAFLKPGESRVYYCNSGDLTTTIVASGKELSKMKIAYHYDESDPLKKIIEGELIAEASDDYHLMNDYDSTKENSIADFEFI